MNPQAFGNQEVSECKENCVKTNETPLYERKVKACLLRNQRE